MDKVKIYYLFDYDSECRFWTDVSPDFPEDAIRTIELSTYTKLKSERDAAVEALQLYIDVFGANHKARAVLAMIDKGEKR